MEIPYGYCHCGCGRKTNISTWNNTKLGYKKGEPFRFLFNHRIPHGFLHSEGYRLLKQTDHHRSSKGYVLEHIPIAEKVLGKPLPGGVVVHHFPSVKTFTHLVICQDQGFHLLLHVRYRALLACGNPNWRKCTFCKKYDDIKNLHEGRNNNKYSYFYHQLCSRMRMRKDGRELPLPPFNLIAENP